MTFVIGKMKLVSFSLFFRCPRPKILFLYVENVYSEMSLSKGHLGVGGGGGASKDKLKDTSFIFPMTNVTIEVHFMRMHRRNKVRFGK